MSIIDELEARGLFADCTDRAGLSELLAKDAPVKAYAGYDPTADSLHIGHLVPTILLKRLQVAGHRPIIVVGGATGMVGDPSGRSDERNLLDDATLAKNVAGIRGQLARLLDFNDGATGAIMTNNADWTRGVGYLEFLRDVGKHLTINYMMGKDSVKSRLEGDGISYTEFSYMLLQAFDFVELVKQYDCRLQVGGSDQYGNITAGCELQRKLGGKPVYGLTAPLLLDATGKKMGKTSTGERVWLDPARSPPFEFYKYWFNIPDSDAPRFLRMFSLRPLAELEELLREHDVDSSKRIAQRELARAMTGWVHGADAVTRIETANRVFTTGTLDGLTADELTALADTIPTVDVARSELAAGLPIVDLLARTVRDSKGKARQLVQQGGAYINNAAIGDVDHKVTSSDLVAERWLLVRAGKKDYRLVSAVTAARGVRVVEDSDPDRGGVEMRYIGSVPQATGYTIEVIALAGVTTSLTWIYIRNDRVSEVESAKCVGNKAPEQKPTANNVVRVVLLAATQGGAASVRINGGVPREVNVDPDATIVFDVT